VRTPWPFLTGRFPNGAARESTRDHSFPPAVPDRARDRRAGVVGEPRERRTSMSPASASGGSLLENKASRRISHKGFRSAESDRNYSRKSRQRLTLLPGMIRPLRNSAPQRHEGTKNADFFVSWCLCGEDQDGQFEREVAELTVSLHSCLRCLCDLLLMSFWPVRSVGAPPRSARVLRNSTRRLTTVPDSQAMGTVAAPARKARPLRARTQSPRPSRRYNSRHETPRPRPDSGSGSSCL
jgi:hypothetical protein